MKKINSPWFCMVQCTIKTPDGEHVSVQGGRGGLEFPDDAVEALIEPVETFRGKVTVLATGMMWSERWGVLSLEDHSTKMQIEADGKALKEAVRREDERKRKERANKKAKERRAEVKVTANNPSAEEIAKAEKEQNLDDVILADDPEGAAMVKAWRKESAERDKETPSDPKD